MVIPAMFRGEEDANLHIWIRRFDDEAHRERLYEAVYGSQEWQENYKPRVRELVDVEKTIVHRVVGTPHSVMR
jgi:thioester reductase-like protein